MPNLDLIKTALYHDKHIIIVNKPSGLLSVPGKGPEGQHCLLRLVQEQLPQALMVHRLDMSTSGLIIIALNKDTQRLMSAQFADRRVGKRYVAVVSGKLTPTVGHVDLPLICDWPNRPRQMVCHESGKPSQTEYRVLNFDSQNNLTRVELTPITGRSHQLRVHMLALGHPIVGDNLYAPTEVCQQATRLLLHAEYLRFIHPITNAEIVIECPADF